MKKYTLYGTGGDIIEESNNKAELIRRANRTKTPATVVEEETKGIIHENKAQRRINNI